jgi:class 3 adenylate cyclase
MQVSELDALQAGRDAHAHHAWEEAVSRLVEADAMAPLEPADLERLGEAARWSGRFDEMLSALERAQGTYEISGATRDAARVALELATMHWERADDAVASGWMARATRLLERVDEGPEHVRLRLAAAHMLLRDGAVEEAAEIAREVVEAGRRYGDRALEGLGLVNLGHALLAAGRVEEALAHIDEASALALGGGLDLDTTGTIFCATIFACRNSGDWRRAGEWTEASLRWCERNAVKGFPGLCRFHRSEVMRMRGALDDAEREARMAIEEMSAAAPRFASFGWGELGEIHRRRGQRDAALAAFGRCAEQGGQPEPGWSLLRAADGDPAGALRTLRRILAEGDGLVKEVGALLPASVAVALSAGDTASAREALAALQDHVSHSASLAERAAAATSEGHLALAERRAEDAIGPLRRGIAGWFEMRAPYEAARARLLLARALDAVDDEPAAALEVEAAEATLERLGASVALEPAVTAAPAEPGRALMTFMFTDMVGSTRLLDALGDEGWNELLGRHDAVIREQFLASAGREIKHEGDGFFVAFADAGCAVKAGCAIQSALAAHRSTGGELPPVRVGIHTASATSRGRDFVGRGVHEAARLVDAARGDEVLISQRTLEAAGGQFEGCHPREIRLQGFRDPIGVVTVPWRTAAPPAARAPADRRA